MVVGNGTVRSVLVATACVALPLAFLPLLGVGAVQEWSRGATADVATHRQGVHAHRDAASLDGLLAALREVETGGEPEGGRLAVGDGGQALGPFQIHRAYWTDAGVPGSFERCRDADYARRVVIAYWERWCPDALRELDLETLARTHNGGPAGARKASTRGYWRKVRLVLERPDRPAAAPDP